MARKDYERRVRDEPDCAAGLRPLILRNQGDQPPSIPDSPPNRGTGAIFFWHPQENCGTRHRQFRLGRF